MTVEDLLEELRWFPLTARVEVVDPENKREFTIYRVTIQGGQAVIEVDTPGRSERFHAAAAAVARMVAEPVRKKRRITRSRVSRD